VRRDRLVAWASEWQAPLVIAVWAAGIVAVHLWGEWLIGHLGRDHLRLSAPPFVGWDDVEIGWPAHPR
jgi:hypothetical protein